jgi:PPOX class probable F420-dependent enzyme
MELPRLAIDLLAGPNFGHLGTVNSDGTVQVSPIWVDVEDGRPVFNTAEGRVKWRNLRRDPRLTLEVSDASDGYRAVEIRGRVAAMTTEGARAHQPPFAQVHRRAFRELRRWRGAREGDSGA